MHMKYALAAVITTALAAPAALADAVYFDREDEFALAAGDRQVEGFESFSGTTTGQFDFGQFFVQETSASGSSTTVAIFDSGNAAQAFAVVEGTKAVAYADNGDSVGVIEFDQPLLAFGTFVSTENKFGAAAQTVGVDVVGLDGEPTLSFAGTDGGRAYFGVVSDTPFTRIEFTYSGGQPGAGNDDELGFDEVSFTVVPEPASAGAVAALALLGLRRRR